MEGATFNHCLIPELVLNQYVYTDHFTDRAQTGLRPDRVQTEDVDFEDVPKPADTPSMEVLSKVFTFKYRQELGFSLLIDFLHSEKDRTDFHADSDWARYALTIYEWKPCILQKRPNTFKEWLPKFCELFGRKWVRDYEPNKLQSAKECPIVPFLPLRETR